MRLLLVTASLLALAGPSRAATLDEGLRLMAEKRYSEAVSVFEEQSRANPGSPEIMLNLGWAYWHVNRLDDAWRIGTTLVKLDPENVKFRIFLANTDVERQDYAAAISLMRRTLVLAPGDRAAALVLARALFLSGRQNEALNLTDGILARAPDDANAAYRRALFLSDMGRKEDALKALDALLLKDPANAAYRRSRAALLAATGREGEAEAEWKDLTRSNPDAQSLMNLGWAYWKEKDYDAAWRIAKLLVKIDDKNPGFLRFQANMEIERMDFADALTTSQRALSLAPGDRDVLLTLSKAYFRMQRLDEALAILRQLIVRYPDDPLVEFRWAEFLGRTGHFEQAMPAYDALLKAHPENDAYRMSRAVTLYEMGRFDEAVAEWKALAAGKTPNAAALRFLRDDASNRRDWESSVQWQKKIIAEDPADPLGWLRLSQIYTLMNDLPQALSAADNGIDADPVSINNYYLEAQTLEQMQNWPAAKKAYQDIARSNPNSIRAFDGLSNVLEAQGNYRGALRAVRRIKELTAPSDSPFLELHKARLLADSGRFARAHKLLKSLLAKSSTPIPILLYHGISPFDRTDSIPAPILRAQLLALKREGYRSITVTELDQALQGKLALPAKPVVITFDDARTDSFVNADPILQETGFRATMFVHLSKLRKPYFHAAPEDIAKWAATGRWDMQSHGWEAHDPMLLDAYGRKGHFLANRMWLPREKRLETLAEFRARVDGDYTKAREGVEAIVPGHRVIAFAFPYGDFGQNDFTNTPEAARINQALVRKNFDLAFVQEQYGMNSLASNPTDLRRFEVPRYMTAEQLLSHLVLNDPRVQERLLDAELWVRANQPARAEAIYAELVGEGIDEPSVWADEGVAFEKAGDIGYARDLFSQAAAAETDKESAEGLTTRRLLEQSGNAAAPTVSAEAQGFSDSDTNAITKLILRGVGMAGSVRLSGWGAQGYYSDRRNPAAPLPHIRGREAGVEASWFATRKLDFDAFYARRVFSEGFTGFADNYSAAAGYQALPSLKLALRDGAGNVETAAAIRAGVKSHSDGAGAAWDPVLNWTANADYDQTWYGDGNAEGDLRLRLTRRLTERVALGAAYFRGDSRESQTAYYTPRGLNQVTGVLTLNQPFGTLNPRTGLAPFEGLIQYEGGYGFQPGGSRDVQSVHAVATVRPFDRVSLSVDGQYAQSPTYLSRRIDGTLSVSF
ncbi:MAG TPA: tetratricopeptide repeat protein [Elusimicrobiota bacterium]|nr:tetratricopeptide repeat protein [Elusimicrobiota bacterium]